MKRKFQSALEKLFNVTHRCVKYPSKNLSFDYSFPVIDIINSPGL